MWMWTIGALAEVSAETFWLMLSVIWGEHRLDAEHKRMVEIKTDQVDNWTMQIWLTLAQTFKQKSFRFGLRTRVEETDVWAES